MQAYWVYLLRCRDGSYYAGHTDNLDKRLWEHAQGVAADWTRKRRPIELAWSAVCDSRDDAFAMERRIKNWSRAKKEALIAGDWASIGHFARPPHERPSTSLGTSGENMPATNKETLVLSEVEGRCSGSLPIRSAPRGGGEA